MIYFKSLANKMTATFFILSICLLSAQQIPLPANLPQGHPRLMTNEGQKPGLQRQIDDEQWAKDVLSGIKGRIDPYVEKIKSQPDWLYSRLMMYWKSHSMQVYINGGLYARAEGGAPAPTPRFGSARGISSPFKRPAIADIVPYMDDTKGVYFRNTAKEGNPLEWTAQSNVSGDNIESVKMLPSSIGLRVMKRMPNFRTVCWTPTSRECITVPNRLTSATDMLRLWLE
jgi:hypothetical protein